VFQVGPDYISFVFGYGMFPYEEDTPFPTYNVDNGFAFGQLIPKAILLADFDLSNP
jgi:hypothetical protein